MARSVEKRRLLDDASDKSKRWELAEIVDPVHCRVATMPDSKDPANKVIFFFHFMDFDVIDSEVIVASVVSCEFRLLDFFTQIRVPAFWLLVQMVSRSYGNGEVMMKIQVER